MAHIVRSLFTRRRSPRVLHPGEWPVQGGKPRVLIENPDGADLWAHADVLREAGYDVAVCGGPAAETEDHERTVCPLVTEGRCPLVDGADVVVSTTRLADGREIIGRLSAGSSPALVVEGTSSDLERHGDVIGDSLEITLPVLPRQLVEAVERVRTARAAD
jgi:hypothetical protein